MTLGLTDGTMNTGLHASTNSSYGGCVYARTTSYGTPVGHNSTSSSSNILGKDVGITTETTKSGIVADLSSGMSAVIKY